MGHLYSGSCLCQKLNPGPKVTTFFKLNSAEHEIADAHEYENI